MAAWAGRSSAACALCSELVQTGDLHGHPFQKCHLPQTRCSPFLCWDSALFFLLLTLEINLLQTLSSRLKLDSLPLSDTHPANTRVVNLAEPSLWQLLLLWPPVPPNTLFSGLCSPRCEMEVRTTITYWPPARGAFKASMWRLVSCRSYPFLLANQHGCLQRSVADWLEGLGTAASLIKGDGCGVMGSCEHLYDHPPWGWD